MGAFKKLAEDEAYNLYDNFIYSYIVMMSLMMGIEDWQEKLLDWKYDIISTIVGNGGMITVSEVRDICGFNAN